MLKPQLHHHHSNSNPSIPTWQHKAFVAGDGTSCGGDSSGTAGFLSPNKLSLPIKLNRYHAARSSLPIKAMAPGDNSIATTTTKVKAIITVQVTMGGLITSIGLTKGLDDIADLLGKSLLLELVAAEVDHNKDKREE